MRQFLLFCVLVFFFGCNTWKESLVEKGNKEDAIQNAILDFSHTKKLFKQDSVFYVGVEDTLYSLKLVSESEYAHQWVPDKPYKDIIGISIIGDEETLYHKKDLEIGSSGKIPSRYQVVSGKLFLWHDDKYPLTKELVNILERYNLIRSDDVELFFITDDGKKGASYYFCRNDLSNYKKEISTIAMGYDVPELKCSK